MQRGCCSKKAISSLRRSLRFGRTMPLASMPWSWNTDLAMSRPIMLMLIAGGSLAAGSDDRILAPMPLGVVHKRHLIHVAGYNLGPIMRLLTGAGTPREFRARVSARFAAAVTPAGGLFVLLVVVAGDQTAAIALSIEPDHFGGNASSSTGCYSGEAYPGAGGR